MKKKDDFFAKNSDLSMEFSKYVLERQKLARRGGGSAGGDQHLLR
jgi:hypothetical protein